MENLFFADRNAVFLSRFPSQIWSKFSKGFREQSHCSAESVVRVDEWMIGWMDGWIGRLYVDVTVIMGSADVLR